MSEPQVFDRIREEIGKNDVLLFMKGTPVFPQCGFSAAVVDVLSQLGVKFHGINILTDGDHYAATVVSAAFAGKSKIQQHQMVYGALGGRMGGVLHALKLTTMAQKP